MSKLTSKRATLLDYSDEGLALQAELSSAPLEGFATHAVDASINEFMKDAKSDVEKGHLYLLWHLINVEEVLDDVAENAIIDGAYDCGIDAYVIDDSEKRIRLFQSKYGESHSKGEIDQFVKDVERFKSKEQSSIRRDELQYLWKHLHEKNMKVELVYVTDQNTDDYETNEVKVIGRQQIYQTLWERIKKPAKDQKSGLKILKHFEHNNSLCCLVSASDLAQFVEKNEHYIYESNIRKHLGGKGSINKKITSTLQENPHDFFEWNNGVTITADSFSRIKDGKLNLNGAQIVNGAQTTKSILDRKKKTNNLDAEVLVTIIKTKDEEHQRNITKYRNSQNAIKGKDYVSLEDYHIAIHSMLQRVGYFYEHQQGSWLNLPSSMKAKFNGDEIYNKYLSDKKEKCRIKDDTAIASMVSYFEQRPNDVYGGIGKYLPKGAKYETVFDDELECDYRYFLFPHLIREYAKNELGYDRSNTQNRYKKYAQNLFVAVTARIVHKNIIGKNDDFKKDISELEKMIQNIGLFTKVLKTADKIVTKFLEDSKVEEKIDEANTAHNFFSNQVYGKSMLEVIDSKIRQEQEEIEYIKKTFSGI